MKHLSAYTHEYTTFSQTTPRLRWIYKFGHVIDSSNFQFGRSSADLAKVAAEPRLLWISLSFSNNNHHNSLESPMSQEDYPVDFVLDSIDSIMPPSKQPKVLSVSPR
jgi:hypothetical protein